MITLAVDAMGGDVGLDVTLPGAKSFLEKVSDAHLILVGDKPSIERKLANEYPMACDRITICHSEGHVAMDDSPFSALRNKRCSSMRLAIDLVGRVEKQKRLFLPVIQVHSLLSLSMF